MSKASPWLRLADRALFRAARSARSHRGAQVIEERVYLQSTVGYRLAAHIHRPASVAAGFGVVLCPGIDDPGTVFDTDQAPVTADEIARLGCVVIHFDPAGRGESWGEEDFGGAEHQDNVCAALRHLGERYHFGPASLGIVSVSLGVSMAVGAAAGVAGAPPAEIAWIIDWEGPSDREIITAGGTKMTPAMGHALHDEVYWGPREAVAHVSRLRCGYLRLQSRADHAQPGELRHARRMIAAAQGGSAAWVELNHGAGGDEAWLRPGRLAANRAIIGAVRRLV